MITGIEGAISNPLTGNSPASTPAANQSVEAQVAAKIASAPIGAEVDVQYQYERGSNGERIVSSARVTITEKADAEGLANRAEAVEDPVSLSINPDEVGLTDSEKAYLKRLQQADAAVRSHEGLHFRAAGGLGDLPNYQTVTGPDGKQYAVAGSVNVSTTSGVSDERKARELETLGIAATAPGDASAADLNAARKFGQSAVAATQESNRPTPLPDEANNIVNIIV